MGAQTLFEAALAAYACGLCPLAPAEDGTKRPGRAWKALQSARPSEEDVRRSFANGCQGLGLVTGKTSGNLEMLELEGRARELWPAFKGACIKAGAPIERLIAGYLEETPSGGIHLLYRCEEIEGNLKLARRIGPDGTVEVLFETRGEGGFVIVAPSGGTVHPSGKPWVRRRGGFDTIPVLSREERRRLLDVARSFDDMPTSNGTGAPLEVPPRGPTGVETPQETFWKAPTGERWMDSVVEDFNRSRTWEDVLRGWAFHHSADGITYWSRPGKDRAEGHSATTNAKGTDRLIVFSSAVEGFETYTGAGAATSYDRFSAWAVLEWAGDRLAAARSLRPSPPPTSARLGSVEAPGVQDTLEAPAPFPDVFLARLRSGGQFLLTEGDVDTPIHGLGDEVLHSSGEATFVVAGTGVGKSTYGQNYALRRIGLRLGDFIGLPVAHLAPGERLLYVAADRPRQILRSLRRMVTPSDRTLLDERLVFWYGPLPYLLNREPQALLAHVRQMEAHLGCVIREVILDSLKDVALELAKDEGGSAVAHAVNSLIGDGRELMVLHHERKPMQAAKKAPAEISDVYGSQLLTACAGNVVYLHGPAGANISTLIHLKQSGEQVGPLELEHNHATGELTLSEEKRDLLTILRGTPKGVTVFTAALLLLGDQDPDRNTQARIYRKLERLVDRGLAWREGGAKGRDGAALYRAGQPWEQGPG